MQTFPSLSIIVPVYNVSEYVQDGVESILNQTYKDYEVILVDDGSTDNSGTICNELAQRNSCIKVVHQSNGGLSAARNTGVKLAKGRFICFLDSDDELGTNTLLQENMDILLRNPEADFLQFPTMWYYGEDNNRIVGENDTIIQGGSSIYENVRSNVITCTAWDKIYSRRIFDYALFPVGRYFEDVWFMTDVIPYCQHVICSSHGYYKYKIRSNSIMTGSMSVKKYKEKLETMLKRLDVVESIKDDSFHYIGYYIGIINLITPYVVTYGIDPVFSDMISLQAKCPSVNVLFSYLCSSRKRQNLMARNILKLIIIRLLGIWLFFKLIRSKQSKEKYTR